MWVLRRTDRGGWVTNERLNPKGGSYTGKLHLAETWPTKEAAERNRCPENEVAERYEKTMRR
jgi:hypothetical protein